MARKRWIAEDKQKMVLAGLRNEASVAELCRQYGVSDVMYYKWKKAFLEGGLNGLKGNGKAGAQESALKKENEELKALIGELTVENRFLKRIQGS
jgi:transposase